MSLNILKTFLLFLIVVQFIPTIRANLVNNNEFFKHVLDDSKSLEEQQQQRGCDAPPTPFACVCSKAKGSCNCCADLVHFCLLPKLHIKVCAVFKYLPKTKQINVELEVAGQTFLNQTLPALNPPPICRDIQLRGLKSFACLLLTNSSIGKHYYKTCPVSIIYSGSASIAAYGCVDVPIAYVALGPPYFVSSPLREGKVESSPMDVGVDNGGESEEEDHDYVQRPNCDLFECDYV